MNLLKVSFAGLSLISLCTPSLQAVAGEGTPSTALSAAQSRAVLRVIRCARDLVQVSSDPLPGKYLALELLLRSRLDVESVSAMDENLRECRRTVRDLRSGALERRDPEFKRARARFADWIAVGDEADIPSVSHGINLLVKDFAKAMGSDAMVACELAGPEVAAGVGVVISADASAGLCTGYDLRRYVAVGASAQIGHGAVVEVSLHGSGVDLKGRADLAQRESLGEYSGLGGGLGGGEENDSTDASAGIGYGHFEVHGIRGTVRLFPVGSDSRGMLFQFLSSDLQ